MKTRYALGIDIGGTSIKYGLCSDRGELLRESAIPTPATSPREEILNHIAGVIEEGLTWAEEAGVKVSAIGIGTPGSVDVERGFLMGGTPNFTHWRDVPIVDTLSRRFSVPIFVDNDANVMAFGEYKFGAGNGKLNVITITLGTGIGSGIIIEGELYRGTNYAGAELGHMSIDYEGKKCKCGGIGCWELYASATAMINDYNQRSPEHPVKDTRELFQRYYRNEPEAQETIARTLVYLGAGLANIINIFNPEMIIVGGGVSEAGDWFVELAAREAFRRAMATSSQGVDIRRARLGNRAGMLGAAAFALHMIAKRVTTP